MRWSLDFSLESETQNWTNAWNVYLMKDPISTIFWLGGNQFGFSDKYSLQLYLFIIVSQVLEIICLICDENVWTVLILTFGNSANLVVQRTRLSKIASGPFQLKRTSGRSILQSELWNETSQYNQETLPLSINLSCLVGLSKKLPNIGFLFVHMNPAKIECQAVEQGVAISILQLWAIFSQSSLPTWRWS